MNALQHFLFGTSVATQDMYKVAHCASRQLGQDSGKTCVFCARFLECVGERHDRVYKYETRTVARGPTASK